MVILIGSCTMVILSFIIFDLIPIFRQKKWKVFWVYTILISFSYIIHFLFTVGVKIPSPAVPLKRFVSYIFGLQD